MAILVQEGFENGGNNIGQGSFSGVVADGGTAISIQETNARNSGRCIKFTAGAGLSAYLKFKKIGSTGLKTQDFTENSIYVRFYFRMDAIPTFGEMIWRVRKDASSDSFRLTVLNSGALSMTVGATTVNGSTIMSIDTWYCIEFRTTINNIGGGGSGSEFKIDGVIQGSKNTSAGGTTHQEMWFGRLDPTGGSLAAYFDDIVVDSSRYPGPGGILRLDVDGVGDVHTWTGGTGSSGYQEIDEVPTDDATTIIAKTNGSANQVSLFTLESATSLIPTGMEVRCIEIQANMNDGATTSNKIKLKTLGGTIGEFSVGDIDSTYREYNWLVPFNPETKTLWTLADLDSLQIGVEAVTTAQPTRCTRLCAYVSFHEIIDPGVERFYATSGVVSSPTSVGFTTISGLGFLPKAILFYGLGVTGDNSDELFSIGAVALQRNNQFCFSIFNDDGVGTTAASGISSSQHCLLKKAGGIGGTVEVAGRVIEIDDDGFRISWEKVIGTAQKFGYLAFGGTEVLAECSIFTGESSTGVKSYSDVTFQPTCLMLFNGQPAADSHPVVGVGAATSTIDQWCAYTQGSDAVGTSVEISKQLTDRISTRDGIADAELDAFHSDGFDLDYIGVTGASTFGYLALSGMRAKAGFFNCPATTGINSISGVGFEPEALLICSSGFASSSSAQSGSKLSIGSADAVFNQSSASYCASDAAGTSEADTVVAEDSIISILAPGSPYTLEGEAVVDDFKSGGFDLNWTTAPGSAREVLYLAFAPLQGDSGTYKNLLLLGVG